MKSKNGKALTKGDLVSIPCRVIAIADATDESPGVVTLAPIHATPLKGVKNPVTLTVEPQVVVK